jgi:hypothetical protein
MRHPITITSSYEDIQEAMPEMYLTEVIRFIVITSEDILLEYPHKLLPYEKRMLKRLAGKSIKWAMGRNKDIGQCRRRIGAILSDVLLVVQRLPQTAKAVINANLSETTIDHEL